MSKYFIITALSVLNAIYLFGQNGQLPYQSKIADMGEIKMEYMDFGGAGM